MRRIRYIIVFADENQNQYEITANPNVPELIYNNASGIDVGVYFFTQAVNESEAIEEAKYVLTALEGYELQMPIVKYGFGLCPDLEGLTIQTALTTRRKFR